MNVVSGTRGLTTRGRPYALLLSFVCSACGGGQTGDEFADVTGKIRGNAKATALTGEIPEETSEQNWQFAWKAYAAESDPTKNVVFSPYSIALTGAMLVDGAAGDTQDEIREAFNFTTTGDVFHQGRRELAAELDSRNRAKSETFASQDLQVNHALWLARGFDPTAKYLDVLSAFYDTALHTADFAGNPDRVRQAINADVAEATNQLVPEVLPPEAISTATQLVLTNALYYKANWAETFDEELTMPMPFRLTDGSEVIVPMMQGTIRAPYGSGDDYEAVAVPFADESFGGHTIDFVAIVPIETPFETWITTLDEATVQQIIGSLSPTSQVQLAMPKFEIDYELPLKEQLMAWGMTKAFDATQADFSPLAGAPGVYLDDAFHSAKLTVTERGVEAGAATALTALASIPPPPVPLSLDRPFVFFIRDRVTNSVLFVGHCVDPR